MTVGDRWCATTRVIRSGRPIGWVDVNIMILVRLLKEALEATKGVGGRLLDGTEEMEVVARVVLFGNVRLHRTGGREGREGEGRMERNPLH